MEGWSEEVQDALYDSFSDLEALMYEVRNCVRGCMTEATTHAELATYIRNIANQLELAAEEIAELPENEA